MLIVYTVGVWDLLHVGHVEFLKRCKALAGNEGRLIVGVAGDQVVKDDKGEWPIIPAIHRMGMLEALRCVDVVVGYYSLSFLQRIKELNPDVFVIGGDWGRSQRHIDAEKYCRNNGIRIVQFTRSEVESTSDIKERIRSR